MRHFLQPRYIGDVVKIALYSLLRHRMRSLLSILGIVGGVAAVFATLSIGEGAKREVLSGIRQLGLENIILRRIPLADIQFQEGVQTIEEGLQFQDVRVLRLSSPAVRQIAYLRELKLALNDLDMKIVPQLVSCSSSYLAVQGAALKSGRFITVHDEEKKALVCILGESVSARLGPQGHVGGQLRIGDQLFLVVGVIKGGMANGKSKRTGVALARDLSSTIFIPFGTHLYLRSVNNAVSEATVDEIIVRLTHQNDVETMVPLIERTMDIQHQRTRQYELIVPRQLMRQAEKTQRIFNLILVSIGGISLVVGGVGIMNVLLATVSERTREIGIRRAVGATRTDIIAQFLSEAVLLTFLGGLTGIAAGVSCSWLIAIFGEWQTAISLFTILIPLFTSVAVGICAGLYPAVQAGKMDPIQALRSA